MVEKIRNKMKEAKGFTLVELIVVLVILAILAALLVPALTGYIDRANEQKITASTRQVVMAAQTVASEEYAKGATGLLKDATDASPFSCTGAKDSTDAFAMKVADLAEVGTVDSTRISAMKGITSFTVKVNGKGTVTEVTVIQNSKTCTYNSDSGDYTVS